jgi:hypothetical protein
MLKKKMSALAQANYRLDKENFEIINDLEALNLIGGLDCSLLTHCGTFSGDCLALNDCTSFSCYNYGL